MSARTASRTNRSAVASSGPCTISAAPNSHHSRSVYGMRSSSSCLPMNSASQPPTSGVSVSFPSEKAPAPPQPVVMSHVGQFTQ